MSRQKTNSGRLPNLLATLPSNASEAPQEIQDVTCPNGLSALPECPWPLEDVITIARNVPLRKTRRDVANTMQVSTQGLPAQVAQLMQMLCLGVALNQNVGTGKHLNLTMLAPREQGLQSLLDKANATQIHYGLGSYQQCECWVCFADAHMCAGFFNFSLVWLCLYFVVLFFLTANVWLCLHSQLFDKAIVSAAWAHRVSHSKQSMTHVTSHNNVIMELYCTLQCVFSTFCSSTMAQWNVEDLVKEIKHLEVILSMRKESRMIQTMTKTLASKMHAIPSIPPSSYVILMKALDSAKLTDEIREELAEALEEKSVQTTEGPSATSPKENGRQFER